MLFRNVADNQSDDSYATAMRRKRFELFLSLLATVPRPLSILDIGGTQGFWERMGFLNEQDVDITILNLKPQPVAYNNFTSVIGNATDLGAYDDNSFDIAFSNSVIEHVGNSDDQRNMANEVMRVGQRYFVQTPNYYFPIEPHYLFPGFQWLPLTARAWLLNHYDLGWSKRVSSKEQARKEVGQIRLLREAEFLALFPGADLYREKVFGFVKSFVVYGGW